MTGIRGARSTETGAVSEPTPVEERLICASPNEAFASMRDVFVTFWRQESTPDGVRLLAVECEKFRRGKAHGVGMFTVVEARTPMPNTATRQVLANFLQHGGSYIKASAVLFDGNSFRASAVRSVATGLSLLAKQPFPHKFFTSAFDALQFLDETLPPKVERSDSEQMLRALNRLRLRVEAASPAR
jgi:hypothetical protein